MQHRWYFAGLHWNQIATDAIDYGLEHNETIEDLNRCIEHQTAQAEM